jgi:sialic acid synthase SpsE
MQVIGCVYEHRSAEFLGELGVDAFKIHSADLSNPELLRFVAQYGRRIDLSVGASTLDEISAAVLTIREVAPCEIWLMYGYQIFPTPTDAIHLDYMRKLQELFELPVGYQDHSAGGSDAGFWLPAVALGMDVRILEKHITDDRAKGEPDDAAALNPDEFARFVKMVRTIEQAKGIRTPRDFSPQEQRYRVYSKKSIVAAADLPAGTTLTRDSLRFMRTPELGLPPDQMDRLIGRTLTSSIEAFALLSEEHCA